MICALANAADGTLQSYRPGGVVTFAYSYSPTFTTQCTRDLKVECELDRDANRLIFTSKVGWNDADVGCSMQPQFVEATCAAETLAEGTYGFGMGTAEATLVVPSDLAVPPCVVQ